MVVRSVCTNERGWTSTRLVIAPISTRLPVIADRQLSANDDNVPAPGDDNLHITGEK
jgi:hypothetical protein